jgi:hypothetical protein
MCLWCKFSHASFARSYLFLVHLRCCSYLRLYFSECLVNNELERLWKETVMASLCYRPGICLEILGKLLKCSASRYSSLNSKREPFECKSDASSLEPAFCAVFALYYDLWVGLSCCIYETAGNIFIKLRSPCDSRCSALRYGLNNTGIVVRFSVG